MTLLQLPPAAGVIDLNGDGAYLSWGVVQVSWANVVVILVMVVVFVLALVLPFPGHARKVVPQRVPQDALPDAAPDGSPR